MTTVEFDKVIRIVSEHPEYPEPCPLLNEIAGQAAEAMDKEWVKHMVREACRQTKEAILEDLREYFDRLAQPIDAHE